MIEEIVEVVEVAEVAQPQLWLIHAVLMGLGTLQLIVSMFIARRREHDRNWLAKHKTLGVTSPLLLLVGFAVAIYMVGLRNSGHFQVLHAIFGLIATGLVVATPVVGFSMLKSKSLRPVHVWTGRLALLMLLGVLVSGLLVAGVF
jgi:hypothetical protein